MQAIMHDASENSKAGQNLPWVTLYREESKERAVDIPHRNLEYANPLRIRSNRISTSEMGVMRYSGRYADLSCMVRVLLSHTRTECCCDATGIV